MATRGSVPPSEEARIHHMSNLEGPANPAGAWAGWVTFAAVVLVLLGCLNGPFPPSGPPCGTGIGPHINRASHVRPVP